MAIYNLSKLYKIKLWLQWKKHQLYMLAMWLKGYRFKKTGKHFFCLGLSSIIKKNSVEGGIMYILVINVIYMLMSK
jgi:hypothetical protein